jgi:hypothetical protein
MSGPLLLVYFMNRALVDEPNMRGDARVAGLKTLNHTASAHGAQIKFGDLTPYLTCYPKAACCINCVKVKKKQYDSDVL